MTEKKKRSGTRSKRFEQTRSRIQEGFGLFRANLTLAVGLVSIAVLFWKHRYENALPSAARVQETRTGVVFGFLPDYRFDAANYEFIVPRVSHLCLFGSEANPETGLVVERLPSSETMNTIRALARKSETKLLLGLGGAGRSGFFSALASDERKFEAFVKSVSVLIRREQLSGIELNWMYPSNDKEIKTLIKMVFRLKREMENEIIISMAIPTVPSFARYFAKTPFDFFHVMAYQSSIGGTDALQTSEKIMKEMMKELPKDRLTLGVPFYGYHKVTNTAISYEEYLTLSKDSNNAQEYLFETRDVLQRKQEFVRQNLTIAGISIWELGQDCRPFAVKQHPKSCPGGEHDSLLEALWEPFSSRTQS